MSDSWRIVGEYQSGTDRWIVISDDAGRLRVESPSVFTSSGPAMIGDVDGARVARWTGRIPRGPTIQTPEVLK